jgi:hypothetical protein
MQYIDTDCGPAASSNPLAGDAVLELEAAAQRRVNRLAVIVARACIERLANGQTLGVRPTFVQRRRFELCRPQAGKEEGVVSCGLRLPSWVKKVPARTAIPLLLLLLRHLGLDDVFVREPLTTSSGSGSGKPLVPRAASPDGKDSRPLASRPGHGRTSACPHRWRAGSGAPSSTAASEPQTQTPPPSRSRHRGRGRGSRGRSKGSTWSSSAGDQAASAKLNVLPSDADLRLRPSPVQTLLSPPHTKGAMNLYFQAAQVVRLRYLHRWRLAGVPRLGSSVDTPLFPTPSAARHARAQADVAQVCAGLASFAREGLEAAARTRHQHAQVQAGHLGHPQARALVQGRQEGDLAKGQERQPRPRPRPRPCLR